MATRASPGLLGRGEGCGGWRLGLIGAKETSHGKSRGNREGKGAACSGPRPARPRREERDAPDWWAPLGSVSVARDRLVSQGREGTRRAGYWAERGGWASCCAAK